MKNEMSSPIFKEPAAKFGQMLFEFTYVLTPAYAIHSSFLIFNSCCPHLTY
jgi:hypothetical protein